MADQQSGQRTKLGELLNNANNGTLYQTFEYLDVVAINNMDLVCKQWRQCGEIAKDSKVIPVKKSFESNRELRRVVKQYVDGDRDDIEDIAGKYGYPIGKWDVSKISDFSWVFAHTNMNEDVGAWNVSNAKNMKRMFFANKVFNKDLKSWDTSKVTIMSWIFYDAVSFNQDLSSWDVSRVTTMFASFRGATSFNQDLSSWNVSKVRDMAAMFHSAESFNQDLSSWKVSRVRDMAMMFCNATSFKKDLRTWEISTDAIIEDMFKGAASFDPEFLPKELRAGDVGLYVLM